MNVPLGLKGLTDVEKMRIKTPHLFLSEYIAMVNFKTSVQDVLLGTALVADEDKLEETKKNVNDFKMNTIRSINSTMCTSAYYDALNIIASDYNEFAEDEGLYEDLILEYVVLVEDTTMSYVECFNNMLDTVFGCRMWADDVKLYIYHKASRVCISYECNQQKILLKDKEVIATFNERDSLEDVFDYMESEGYIDNFETDDFEIAAKVVIDIFPEGLPLTVIPPGAI